MSKEYTNHINLNPSSIGNARRIEMLNEIVNDGTFLPKTLEYKDIDEAFRDWVKSLTIVSDDGVEYPTMTLFSNQRFSEYSQSWQYVDENKNLLLNFKTITRENNPKYGEIQSGLWNIPGERFYTMKKKKVLDENGSESYLILKMRQPMAIDLNYKVSIFTTRYTAINEFNTIINKCFSACQCYIQPNGHFIPMTLENIADESQYNINDRQFYSQTYQIKVMGYVITENDYRVDEVPLKIGLNMGLPKLTKKKAEIEMEELEYKPIFTEDACGRITKIYVPLKTGRSRTIIDVSDLECNEEDESKYYYKPINVNVILPKCIDKARFSIPSDVNFVVTAVTSDHGISNIQIYVNDEQVTTGITADNPLILRENDEVRITANKGMHGNEVLKINLGGYSPDIVYAETLDDLESILDEEQVGDEYEVNDEE